MAQNSYNLKSKSLHLTIDSSFVNLVTMVNSYLCELLKLPQIHGNLIKNTEESSFKKGKNITIGEKETLENMHKTLSQVG